MSTRDFRWLHEQDWEDAQREAYAFLRQAPVAGAFSPTPFQKSKKAKPAFTLGRWVLELPYKSPRAAVEVQVYARSVVTLTLLLSNYDDPERDGWTKETSEPLAFLLSGLILATKADLVRVVPLGEKLGQQLSLLGWGQYKQVWTPLALDTLLLDPQSPSGLRLTCLEIEAEQWWQGEVGGKHREAFRYLERRVDAAEKAAKRAASCALPRRPRSFLGRLFFSRR